MSQCIKYLHMSLHTALETPVQIRLKALTQQTVVHQNIVLIIRYFLFILVRTGLQPEFMGIRYFFISKSRQFLQCAFNTPVPNSAWHWGSKLFLYDSYPAESQKVNVRPEPLLYFSFLYSNINPLKFWPPTQNWSHKLKNHTPPCTVFFLSSYLRYITTLRFL